MRIPSNLKPTLPISSNSKQTLPSRDREGAILDAAQPTWGQGFRPAAELYVTPISSLPKHDR